MGKTSIIAEFWQFLKVRKKYWLAPIAFILILLGFLIAITQGTAIAPFIYTLFQAIDNKLVLFLVFGFIQSGFGHELNVLAVMISNYGDLPRTNAHQAIPFDVQIEL